MIQEGNWLTMTPGCMNLSNLKKGKVQNQARI